MELLRTENSELKKLLATTWYSGFERAHDTYNALSVASDGNLYYVLSSKTLEPGRLYCHNPRTGKSKFIADLNEICGESGINAIPQGKSHAELYEYRGKLYIATHIGYYEMIGGFERLPVNAPEGYQLYPGGHLLSYDLQNGTFQDMICSPDRGGFVSMAMDTERGQIYLLTWPEGRFLHYDLKHDKLRDLGPVRGGGEGGEPGDDYRVICRSILIDQRDGRAFVSDAEGNVWTYRQGDSALQLFPADLRRDYFGVYDVTRPGSMGYNWRKIFWYTPGAVAYGIHGNSGYLFRLDPDAESVELVERITSELSRRSGMYDQFTYGYLGFALGPDGETIYYLTGGPIYENGKLLKGDVEINVGSRGTENLHLVTYNLSRGEYSDHGAVFYQNGSVPSYVNSIALAEGKVYALARFEHEGRVVNDLISIPDPLANSLKGQTQILTG